MRDHQNSLLPGTVVSSIFSSPTRLTFNVSCLSFKDISELKDVAIQSNRTVIVCGPALFTKCLGQTTGLKFDECSFRARTF